MQLGNVVDVLHYLVASSWHFTLFNDQDARSKNPPVELSFYATRAFGKDTTVQTKIERYCKKCTYSRKKIKNGYIASNCAIQVCSCCILRSKLRRQTADCRRGSDERKKKTERNVSEETFRKLPQRKTEEDMREQRWDIWKVIQDGAQR